MPEGWLFNLLHCIWNACFGSINKVWVGLPSRPFHLRYIEDEDDGDDNSDLDGR